MKKPFLYLFLGIVVGASGLQAARMLRSELKNRHAEKVETARLDWQNQADAAPTEKRTFSNRFSTCNDQQLLRYFNLKRNRTIKTEKAEADLEIWNRFLSLFAAWPQGLKNYCERYVSGVYVVGQLGSSAYVLQQNDTSFVILIDRDAMETRPNDWFNNRERTAVDLPPSIRMAHTIEADSNNRPEFTLESLLLHELGHCIGITSGQTRKFDSSWRQLDQRSLLHGVFGVDRVKMAMDPELREQFDGLHYYRNERLSANAYLTRLGSLRQSPFPTMYSTVNDHEYFADLTEAWFWENDFYPYNREQLLTHDPVGAAAVEAAWTVND